MLKKEIIGILKDKRTFLIILLVLIIPIIDLSVEYKQMNVAYARKHEKEIIARDLMMKKECEKDGSKYFTNWNEYATIVSSYLWKSISLGLTQKPFDEAILGQGG